MNTEQARANLADASGGTRLPAEVLAATFKERGGPAELTREETMIILDQQIAALSDKKFQTELWKEFPHDDDILEKRKKVEWLCLPIKGKIADKFGYGSDVRGVKKCEGAMAEDEDDKELTQKHNLVEYLSSPDVQKKKDGASASAAKASQAAGGQTNGGGGAGTSWVVVGGADTDGILAREGQDLNSAKCAERLATGAEVEELQLVGGRLQFRKLKGNGPETGWVSLELKGKALVEKKA